MSRLFGTDGVRGKAGEYPLDPPTVRRLGAALVRGLRFIQTSSAEEMAKVMPEEYALGDKALYLEAIKHSVAMYSPDGRFAPAGAQTAYDVLKAFDPAVGSATIDLAKTFTNTFVEKVPAR